MNNHKLKNHPLLRKKEWKRKAIPIAFHGDGAAIENNDSLVTVSCTGLLKDGPTLETCLFLASWPKHEESKGPGGTWDIIWEWLVWDLNQLFHNKYADKDPWNNDLPADMAERAGQAILPDDYFVVTWGVQGDMQNELGRPHHKRQPPNVACQACGCDKAGGSNDWFDFVGDWHGT